MTKNLRVALFADSFLEVDGAAMTCRRLVEFAKEREYPLICIHAGPKTAVTEDGSVTYLSLKRSWLAISMDHDLAYDPVFQRHATLVRSEIERFRPDVFHITGLNDVSIVGSYLGWRMQTPILGSWHTNLHEFAARRLQTSIGLFNQSIGTKIAGFAEKAIFAGALLYYRVPKLILAPNRELVEKLESGTRRTARLMARGVDSVRFTPAKRTVSDDVFRLGFVGRLQPEKNVRLLVDLERAMTEKGKSNFSFLIVGEGSERVYLETNLRNAQFTGFIDGLALSEAYANMDAFVFPSETDTFGNVIQEAMASGVPSIVSDKGGPKYVIRHGEDGYVATNFQEFVDRAIELLDDPEKTVEMKRAARRNAKLRSWESIFEGVYEAYGECAKHRSNDDRVEHTFEPDEEKTDDTAANTFKLKDVFRNLIRHPIQNVLLRWNWKSALLSALLRSPIFFTVYLAQKQGLWIATGAMAVQFVFRTFFGGVNGAILQAFSKVRPSWHAVIVLPLTLAAVSHFFEFGIQAAYDTLAGAKGKSNAVTISVSISIISALFNLFAMRRGLLLVRDESGQSLWRDMKQMPPIALEFLAFPFVWTWRRAKRA